MNILFKCLGFLFSALFLISAGLQYNDPDSLVWIIIWTLAAFISLGFTLNKIPFQIILGTGVLAFIGFLYTYPDKFEGFEIGVGNIRNVEEGRESFGLLIIAIVLLTFSFRTWCTKKIKG